MKKIYSLGAGLALLALSVPAMAGAQGLNVRVNTNANVRASAAIEAKRGQMDQAREARERNAAEARAAAQARFDANFNSQAAANRISAAIRVAENIIGSLERIADRIDSRIAKIEARGGDTDEAKGFVADARADLAAASDKVEVLASVDLSAEITQDEFRRIRTTVGEIRELARSARASLIAAIRSLGNVEMSLDAEANL